MGRSYSSSIVDKSKQSSRRICDFINSSLDTLVISHINLDQLYSGLDVLP